jgi:hypothetical protein
VVGRTRHQDGMGYVISYMSKTLHHKAQFVQGVRGLLFPQRLQFFEF